MRNTLIVIGIVVFGGSLAYSQPASNDYGKAENWLCRPGGEDACAVDLSATVISEDGRMTAEKFVPDPFSTHGNARMYKTGDLGRWRADGTISFLGRNDRQVKIRGFRIETGEIEACLRRQPLVKDAVVIAHEVTAGERQLVAYVIADAVDRDALISGLRDSLREWLPEYMIPSTWSLLDQWPLTPSGKVDRKALPTPDDAVPKQPEFVEPCTDLERTLANIWSLVLRVDRIGRHDNFFELGGHSLLVIRTVSRINEALDVKLTGVDLYRSPTVADLAKRVQEGEGEDGFVNLSKEAVLDDFIAPVGGLPAGVPSAILLTGATVSALYVANVTSTPTLGWADVTLASGETYKVKVVRTAASTQNRILAAEFLTDTGFTTQIGPGVVSTVPAGYLAKRMVVEVPFVLFAILMPFVSTGPRIDVLGVAVSEPGLLAAWGLLVKGTLGVMASLTLVTQCRIQLRTAKVVQQPYHPLP